MTRLTVHEYAAAVRPRYRTASKREKGRILDEFCQTTGLHRKAATRLLNQPGGARLHAPAGGRPRRYGREALEALVQLWEVNGRPCGKLLKPVIPDLLSALERHGEISVGSVVRAQLVEISAAGIDRLLRLHKRRGLRQPHLSRPGTAGLKSQVPIRTWSEWRGAPVGSIQADLVLHCGESLEDFYLTTLCAIDVATGWTELQAVWGLGKTRVGTAVHLARQRLPFAMKSLHTDNGSEFLNHTLASWCIQEKIGFSRGRAYRKNDQAYVEQRNWIAVRREIGYDRLNSKAAYTLLQQLYALLRLQLNFFRPVRKLIAKERQGAKVVKRYDTPRTPYQRLIASGSLSREAQARLDADLVRINPAELQHRIEHLKRQLWRDAQDQGKVTRRFG
jgi:hypothetical protein